VKNIPYIDSIAIGLQSKEEIDSNIYLLEHDSLPKGLKTELSKKNRRLIVADYCIGCGNCQRRCQQKAIEVIDGIAIPNDKCILCGYCATVCPEFCIKVI
jgi:ferredoxin